MISKETSINLNDFHFEEVSHEYWCHHCTLDEPYPLATTFVQQWLRGILPGSVQKGTNLILAIAATCSGGHLRPLAATRLAASGCRWKENAGARWRPLAATRVAASGCKWLPMKNQMLVAAGGHWSGCKWRRKMWKSFRGRMSGGHLRPLAATRVAARGCKWMPFPKSNYAPPACSMGILIINVLLLCHFQVLWGLEFFGGSVVAELHNAGSCTIC